ncbi:MAG TPA: FKBP-type peptidyl-prolyl cis-trans isomerase [Vicinamibacterales bacterium]|nr:FKBP-type peptidyl-prolyl cis-trans isomerase [Vicinamibacterales bacterium]
MTHRAALILFLVVVPPVLASSATAPVAATLIATEPTTQTPPAPQAMAQIPAPPDVAAPPADAERTATGLASKVVKPGQGGEKPKADDVVTVHYTGWTTDGKMFDSSHSRNNPSTFPLNRVIPGWRDCVTLMVVGETRRCWIPQDLAYRGQAGRPAGMLVFNIELIAAKPSPTAAPADVGAPPSDAKRTPSGLAYKVLTPGTGSQKPNSRSRVTVHYTGWTTDGKMFDSSVTSGQPATFGLDQVIAGWTEGVQLMVEGEKARFWIPQDLAYKGQPGAPRGMLVFDVELIKIQR